MTENKSITFSLNEKESWQIYYALNFRAKVLSKEGQEPLSEAHSILANKIKSILTK